MVLLYKNQLLFTGDHLDFDRDTKQLEAFLSWIFPGHGQRVHLNEDEMHTQMIDLVARMKI